MCDRMDQPIDVVVRRGRKCTRTQRTKYQRQSTAQSITMSNEVRQQPRSLQCLRLKRRRNMAGSKSISMSIPAASAYVAAICLLSTGMIRGSNSYNLVITFPSSMHHLNYRPVAERRILATSLAVSIADNGGSLYEDFGSPGRSPTFEVTHSAIICLKLELKDRLYRNHFLEVLQIIQRLLQIYSDAAASLSANERSNLSSEIDSSIQEFLILAFTTPTVHDHRRVRIGIDVLNMQLSTMSLASPYNTIPRRVLLNAIAAISTLPNEGIDYTSSYSQEQLSYHSYVAISYRLLQRLISHVGVRGQPNYSISEKEFNQVLHVHCKVGHMMSSERIVKLQERTVQQSPISLVTFSILLKGYGQKRDLRSVENTILRATSIPLDTIMINTIIDAYINCNAIERAEAFFCKIKNENLPINRRTYNTYMKGLAKQGELGKAQQLAYEMKQRRLWDSVTTNTLVHASIVAGNLSFAEEILDKETMRSDKYKYQHPNVEAYTELLDTYSKSNHLDLALSVLQTMQHRNVEPNEVTYTCLMGGLGRSHRIDLAQKILTYMESRGQRPTTKMYNALFSGLFNETITQAIDGRVDDGMKLLIDMKQSNVRPNSVTASIFVDALGRCSASREVEAQLLVDELIRSGCVSECDNRVLTSLLRLYGRVGNFQQVTRMFQKVKRPDTVAINAYIDACCRCGREKMAIDAFEFHFRNTKKGLQRPDVVTYAVLIGSILKRSTPESLRQARLLYADMKNNRNISPDNGMVDVVLKSMIRIGTARQLTKHHVVLIAEVLQDAELLFWDEGQLNRRRRAIRAIMLESFGNVLRSNDPVFDLIPTRYSEDDLFDRKGWNQVNSGFRMWGPTDSNKETDIKDSKSNDNFLKSHGWNDVDSNFRFI